MRKVFILAMGLFSVIAAAQNNIISEVCGVKFGTSFNEAKNILNKRYGIPSRVTDDGTLIAYEGKNYDGKVFDQLYFVFEKEDNFGFDVAVLSIACKTKNDAEKERDNIADLFKEKYNLDKRKNISGDIVYYGGTSPLNNKGYGFRIEIYKDDDSSLTGESYNARIIFGAKLGDTTNEKAEKDVTDKSKLQHYIDIVQAVARMGHSNIKNLSVEYEELLSIGIIAIQVMIKNKTEEQLSRYNDIYIATAVQWAIRNEMKIRYKEYKSKDVVISDDPNYDDFKQFSVRVNVYRVVGDLYNFKDRIEDSSFKEVILNYANLIREQIESITTDDDREVINDVIFSEKTIDDIAKERKMSYHETVVKVSSILDEIKKGLAGSGATGY